jgi:undecaprenyl-diphosphatase
MIQGLLGRNSQGLRLVGCLLVAFAPAAVIGALFNEAIERRLFGVAPIIGAWVVGGVVILLLTGWVERRRTGRELFALDYRHAFIVGLLQCLAMWPGTSRSLVTILGGLLVGLSLPAAVEFAFLLGVVTLTAATGYTSLKHGSAMMHSFGIPVLLVGFITAWISAAIAVKWMVAWLNRRGLAVFAWWRFAAAAVAAWLLLGAS